jgi:hypothetical protein
VRRIFFEGVLLEAPITSQWKCKEPCSGSDSPRIRRLPALDKYQRRFRLVVWRTRVAIVSNALVQNLLCVQRVTRSGRDAASPLPPERLVGEWKGSGQSQRRAKHTSVPDSVAVCLDGTGMAAERARTGHASGIRTGQRLSKAGSS